MEGYLVKWTNIISRWKKRYVVVDKDRFAYYKKKDGKLQGSHNLKGVMLEIVHSDPAGFKLNFGGGEVLQFRANDAAEKQKWLLAIQAGKILADQKFKSDPSQSNAHNSALEIISSQLVNILRKRIINGSSKLCKDMTNIMNLQEQLENAVAELVHCLDENKSLPPRAAECAEIIQNSSKELKVFWLT